MVRTPFEVPAGIRPAYEKWFTFMMESVDFALKISPIHTKEHASRVLLFALLMAEQMELPPKDWEILGAAAAFHDTRRQDDWLDVGHGKRAARYYHAYCRGRGLPYYRLTAAGSGASCSITFSKMQMPWTGSVWAPAGSIRRTCGQQLEKPCLTTPKGYGIRCAGRRRNKSALSIQPAASSVQPPAAVSDLRPAACDLRPAAGVLPFLPYSP